MPAKSFTPSSIRSLNRGPGSSEARVIPAAANDDDPDPTPPSPAAAAKPVMFRDEALHLPIAV